jgi:putative colanic acid biosynthesis acetyltransferase WcaF
MDDLSNYHEEKPHLAKRILWRIVNATLFRLFPGVYCRNIRRWLLVIFGAKISRGSLVYASCSIFAPWNLTIGRGACIGPHTTLFSKAPIAIGDNTVISQGAYLCTGSHDISSLMLPIKNRPITIGNNVWVASEAFVGPGVTIGDGAVVAARAAVFDDVAQWSVVRGNPATVIKQRIIKP